MYSVGLVGHGAFGEFLSEKLQDHCDFTIYDPVTHPGNVREALEQPVTILAIPVQSLDEFLAENQNSLNPTGLYVDVCSVKIAPVEIMQRRLPPTADIIATHPLFGPASAVQGLDGQPMMVHPVRVPDSTYGKFKDFLTSLRLNIIETTPEEHDRALAYVQGLSHFIGRIMQTMGIPDSELATRAYNDLLDMRDVQGNDSAELFSAITTANPYTRGVLAEFEAAAKEVKATFDL